MKFRMLWVSLLSPLLVGALLGQEKIDSSKHAVQMVRWRRMSALRSLIGAAEMICNPVPQRQAGAANAR